VQSHRDHFAERGALTTGLAVNAVLCLGELAGGWWTNSLALMTDAVHMFTDVGALGLTLFALQIGHRPASASKTYGYYRAEILAALVNGIVLCLLVLLLLLEAWRRFGNPPPVHGQGMLVVAALGLAANVFVALRLRGHTEHSLNMRGAYLHVLSDLLGSVGAVGAAVVILVTGATVADALASVAIGILVLASAWSLVRDAVDVLMEAVPPHVDVEVLQRALEAVGGVEEVHDLHVWTLTTGHYALSAHAVVDGSMGDGATLDALAAVCAERFHIEHVTIQLEHENRRAAERGH